MNTCPRWWCNSWRIRRFENGVCLSCGWKAGDELDDLVVLRKLRGSDATPLAFLKKVPIGKVVRERGYCNGAARVVGWADDVDPWTAEPSAPKHCETCRCSTSHNGYLGWWRLERLEWKEAFTMPPWALVFVEPVDDYKIGHVSDVAGDCPSWCGGCRFEKATRDSESAAESAAWGMRP